MDTVLLKLTRDEAVAIINLIGSLPTNQNAYPLFMKLNEQFRAQEPVVKDAQ